MKTTDVAKKINDSLFGKLTRMFSTSGRIPINIGDRVRDNETRKLGKVVGVSKIKGSSKIPAISVQFDDGTVAIQVPANQFLKPVRA